MTFATGRAFGTFAATYRQSIAEVLQGNERIGLGFFLDELILVTCSHVVRDAGSDLRIRTAGGERLVRLAYDNAERDVAFLKLDAPASSSGFELKPLELEGQASPGAAIEFVGWQSTSPAVQRPNAILQSGRIQGVVQTSLSASAPLSEFYELSDDCQPGYSGGPLVLEGQGRACGLIAARDPGVGRALVVPGQVVADCFQALVAETHVRDGGSPSIVAPLPHVCVPPGGRYNPNEHLPRIAIEQQASMLFDGKNPIVLCAPTLSGKTWWLNHLLPSLKAKLGVDGCVATPLSSSFGKNRDMKGLLGTVIESLVRSVRGDARAAREAWDDDLDPSQASANCLEQFFFARLTGRALLILELPDEFWDNPRQGEFFELLRSWSTAGDPWDRLHLLVGYSTTPSVWTGSVADSPFSVMPIMIEDWNKSEIQRVAKLYGHVDVPDTLVDKMHSLLGGHPYLIRFVCYDASTQRRQLAAYVEQLGQDPSAIAPIVERLFTRCRLRDDISLQESLRRVARPSLGSIRGLEYKQFRKLFDAGLIRGTVAKPSLRCAIFAQLLF